jgi:rhamnosyltransferase
VGRGGTRIRRASLTASVSIVIPTWNAGSRLDDVLDALDGQVGEFGCRVIAVDSGSTDGTRERLRDRGARVIDVRPADFNHGATRNLGLAAAEGAFAVLLVQDAVPAGPGWLQGLVAPLIADDLVAGSFSRQCPAPGASRLTTEYLSRWIASRPEPRVVGPLTTGEYEGMSPADRLLVCAFDNVCACVRLAVWRAHPFRRTSIAEDLEWAREVLLAGYKLAYAPEAFVWHSHERPVAYEFQRTYLVHRRLQALFGLATIPSVPSLLRAVATTVPANVRLAANEERGRVRVVLRNAALGVALPVGQYLGAQSSRTGRDWIRTGRI